MLIYEGNPSRNEVHMKITKKYLKKLDQKLSLIPLIYDRAFKSVFKINLDILKEFLKVTIWRYFRRWYSIIWIKDSYDI